MTPRIHRVVHGACGPVALAVALAVLGACSGIVVEPANNAAATGPTKFWGYATEPGSEMRLEAQNTSGTWELIVSTTSVTRATYASGHTGYYWELTSNPELIATRFRRPATSSYTVFYRVKNPDLNPAETHDLTWSVGSATTFEQLWTAFKGDGIVRLNVF